MPAMTYNQLKRDLASALDEVCDSRAPLVVTREDAPAVVIMRLDEFEGWKETAYLLSTPANAEALLRSIADANAGQVEEHELVE